MISLDRIKFVTDIKYIISINSKLSTVIFKNNTQKAIRIKQTKPFNLYISYNPSESNAIIEFSSKILLNRYSELITIKTIYSCLENINKLGYCVLDIDKIISDSKIISIDITSDVDELLIHDNLSIAMKSCINNTTKYHVQKYTNSGYTITKDVKTMNRKVRFSIYNKYKELLKSSNSDFLATVSNKDDIMKYYYGKYRIEANVKTIKQIKEFCQTESSSLLEVLNSKATPLLKIFDSIFKIPDMNKESDNDFQSILNNKPLSKVKNMLLIKACNNDPEQIDLVLNNCLSPKTNKGKYKSKLTKLISAQPQQNENFKLMHSIREKLIANEYR